MKNKLNKSLKRDKKILKLLQNYILIELKKIYFQCKNRKKKIFRYD